MTIALVLGVAFVTTASSLVTNVIALAMGLFTSGVDMADLFFVLKNSA